MWTRERSSICNERPDIPPFSSTVCTLQEIGLLQGIPPASKTAQCTSGSMTIALEGSLVVVGPMLVPALPVVIRRGCCWRACANDMLRSPTRSFCSVVWILQLRRFWQRGFLMPVLITLPLMSGTAHCSSGLMACVVWRTGYADVGGPGGSAMIAQQIAVL